MEGRWRFLLSVNLGNQEDRESYEMVASTGEQGTATKNTMTMDSSDTEGVMFILFQLERDVD